MANHKNETSCPKIFRNKNIATEKWIFSLFLFCLNFNLARIRETLLQGKSDRQKENESKGKTIELNIEYIENSAAESPLGENKLQNELI